MCGADSASTPVAAGLAKLAVSVSSPVLFIRLFSFFGQQAVKSLRTSSRAWFVMSDWASWLGNTPWRQSRSFCEHRHVFISSPLSSAHRVIRQIHVTAELRNWRDFSIVILGHKRTFGSCVVAIQFTYNLAERAKLEAYIWPSANYYIAMPICEFGASIYCDIWCVYTPGASVCGAESGGVVAGSPYILVGGRPLSGDRESKQ